MTPSTVPLVLAAGAVGALARYLVTVAALRRAVRAEVATLGINVAGSLALGALIGAGPRLSPALVSIAGAGFLGAFTTFATFAVQSVQPADQPRTPTLRNVAVMVVACAAAAAAGAGITGVVWL